MAGRKHPNYSPPYRSSPPRDYCVPLPKSDLTVASQWRNTCEAWHQRGGATSPTFVSRARRPHRAHLRKCPAAIIPGVLRHSNSHRSTASASEDRHNRHRARPRDQPNTDSGEGRTPRMPRAAARIPADPPNCTERASSRFCTQAANVGWGCSRCRCARRISLSSPVLRIPSASTWEWAYRVCSSRPS